MEYLEETKKKKAAKDKARREAAAAEGAALTSPAETANRELLNTTPKMEHQLVVSFLLCVSMTEQLSVDVQKLAY